MITIKQRISGNLEIGAVMVEFVFSLILLLTIVLAFAQQYLRSIDKLAHYSLANQVTFGPQLPTLAFNQETGEFQKLSNDSRVQFLTLISEFLSSMAPDDKYSFQVGLGYLGIDPEKGYILKTNNGYDIGQQSEIINTSLGGALNPCNDGSVRKASLHEFMNEKLKELITLAPSVPSPQVPDILDPGDEWRVGLKIYDFKLGDTQYRQYSEYYPYIFVSICSNPVNIIYPQQTVTYHMISPRRLVN